MAAGGWESHGGSLSIPIRVTPVFPATVSLLSLTFCHYPEAGSLVLTQTVKPAPSLNSRCSPGVAAPSFLRETSLGL